MKGTRDGTGTGGWCTVAVGRPAGPLGSGLAGTHNSRTREGDGAVSSFQLLGRLSEIIDEPPEVSTATLECVGQP